jgi:hypothetical protein
LIGRSSTPRLLDFIDGVSENWIARRSLSSGGAARRPIGGRRQPGAFPRRDTPEACWQPAF